ncbi:hypothetical protein ACIKTA_17060, partial [Hansschlegelia beijingensis]
ALDQVRPIRHQRNTPQKRFSHNTYSVRGFLAKPKFGAAMRHCAAAAATVPPRYDQGIRRAPV